MEMPFIERVMKCVSRVNAVPTTVRPIDEIIKDIILLTSCISTDNKLQNYGKT